MAKVNSEARADFNLKQQEYKEKIEESLKKEKEILAVMHKDTSGTAYKKMLLAEEVIYVSTLYIAINNISVELLDTKNNDALNDSRKMLYKAIIYLEEVVTNTVDCPYSELEDKVAQISNTPLEKRYYIVRKIGLAIRMLMDAYGENTKWKWTFAELQARLAVVAKNMIDMKQAAKDYFEPRSQDYENTVKYVRLVRKLLDQGANGYRDRYELSTHRIDDMRMAMNLVLALRRIAIVLGDKDQAEELKKKVVVWKDKLAADQKNGIAN